MRAFLELHWAGKKLLVNIGLVQSIQESEMWSPEGFEKKCASLLFENKAVYVEESYEEVKMMVAEAQGGIPMEPSRMY